MAKALFAFRGVVGTRRHMGWVLGLWGILSQVTRGSKLPFIECLQVTSLNPLQQSWELLFRPLWSNNISCSWLLSLVRLSLGWNPDPLWMDFALATLPCQYRPRKWWGTIGDLSLTGDWNERKTKELNLVSPAELCFGGDLDRGCCF